MPYIREIFGLYVLYYPFIFKKIILAFINDQLRVFIISSSLTINIQFNNNIILNCDALSTVRLSGHTMYFLLIFQAPRVRKLILRKNLLLAGFEPIN